MAEVIYALTIPYDKSSPNGDLSAENVECLYGVVIVQTGVERFCYNFAIILGRYSISICRGEIGKLILAILCYDRNKLIFRKRKKKREDLQFQD